MAEEKGPISARPAAALALWLGGTDPPPTLAPSQDRLGAELYERALTLYRDAGEPRFLSASTDAPLPTLDAYAMAAVIVRRSRADTLTDINAALTHAIVHLGQTMPEGDSPSLWTVGSALLVEAFRYEVLRDDSLMWKMAETTLAGEVADYDLFAIDELCVLAKSRSTLRAQRLWARLRYDVLLQLCTRLPSEQRPLDDRFDAISDYANVVLPASSPAPAEWITAAIMETLRDLARFIANGHPAFDLWIGTVLRICDALMSTGRLADCGSILRLAVDVVDRCGPGGPYALEPDQPSPRRKDAAFLLELLGTAPEASAS